jgi:hypothetical protein
MGRGRLIATVGCGLAGIVLAAVVDPMPVASTIALLGAVGALAGVPALGWLLLRGRDDIGGPFVSARLRVGRRRSPEPARPYDYLALTRNAYDLNVHFRPFLSSLVADLLAIGPRVDLERDPLRARELLGPELRALIWPAASPAQGYRQPGLEEERLGRLLDELEQLAEGCR